MCSIFLSRSQRVHVVQGCSALYHAAHEFCNLGASPYRMFGCWDCTSSAPTALTTGGEVWAVLAPPSQALLVVALCVWPFWPHALGSYVLPYPVS